MSNKKKKLDKLDKASLLAAGIGGSALAIGLNREAYQKNIDPDYFDVVGGSAKNNGSLEVQRRSWAKELSNTGSTVKELAHFPEYTYKRFLGTEKEVDFHGMSSAGNPIAEFHVSKPKSPIGVAVKRLLTGKQSYRVFSDFGYGPHMQNKLPIEDMRAYRVPVYTRNVVPGGDLVAADPVVKKRPNINVTTIPTDKVFHTTAVVPTNSVKKALIYPGGGIQWGRLFSNPEPVFDSIIEGMDKKHGKGNYELELLAAGLGSKKAESFKKRYPNMKINMGIPRADMPKLLTSKDVIFMAPGSTVAELAAIEGYKPKVIAFKKQHEILGPQGQFDSNPKWYRKAVGGIESIDVHKITGDKIVDGLNSVEKQTVNSDPVRMQTSDILKMKNTVREDAETAKVFTKNLKTSGKFALGAGIGALVTNKIHKFIMDRN